MFLLAEAYPDLKASTSFLQLQHQLAEIEENIAFARRYHNAVVEDHNTRIQTFPSVLVAGMMGFRRRDFFQARGAARSVPEVGFDSSTGGPTTPPAAPPAAPTIDGGGADFPVRDDS